MTRTGDIPKRRRPPNRPLLVLGLGLLATVMLVLGVRWWSPGSPVLIAFAGLTPFFAGPLALGAVASWFSRSLALRVTAAVTAAAFLFTTSPIDAVVGCGAETAPDAITVYTANVLFDAGRPDDVAASILAQDPDVIVLQELEHTFFDPFRVDPRLDHYRHRSDDLTGRNYGTVVWSRWPFSDFQVQQFEVSEIVTATIAGPTGDFTVTGLHTLAPAQPHFVPTWQAQLDQLASIDTSTPRILAGDFNATTDHRPFRNLLDSGWTDVHDRKGCGLDHTWPVGHGYPVPLMRLDHVLVTDDFEVLDVRFGDPAGSDHKPVVTDIRLS